MTPHDERLRRWRLVLGGGEADGLEQGLTLDDIRIDKALQMVYDPPEDRRGGLGSSAPKAALWLGDIREFFPSSVVQVIQKDALERLNLQELLFEPEMMAAVEPDINLLTTIMSLSSVIPAKAKASARQIVRKIVDDLLRRLDTKTRQAVTGALRRSVRRQRPRHNEIDWNRTIRANLKHYQSEYKTVIPERRIGYGRQRSQLYNIILCIDQSGSMGQSVVYSGLFGSVLASIPAVSLHVVSFDTAVVDLSDKISDPVDVLLGLQLGGGTDINRALQYCQSLIHVPTQTLFVLVTDLYEGGNNTEMLSRAKEIVDSGVRMVTLLALSDEGTPTFDVKNAAAMARRGIPSFGCTPDKFVELMSAAIQGRDLGQWASEQGLMTTRAEP